MNIRLLSILCAAVVISSCSKVKDDVTTTNNSNQPSYLSNARTTGSPFIGGVLYHANTSMDLPCNCQGLYPAGTFSGSGNLSHLGLSTSDIKPCVSPIFTSNGAYVGNHVGIECASFVAANGDVLNLNIHPYDIMFTAAGPVGTANVDIIGGTGRFASATGSFTGTVTILSATDASFTNIKGTISY